MRKIKVLRIIARLNVGGPARHVAILTEGLAGERHTSKLLYGSLDEGEGDMSYLVKKDGIDATFIPELVRRIDPVNDLIAFAKIFSIIRRERPDIVHTHTAKAGTIGRLAALAAGVPVKVHTFHGHIFYGYFSVPLTRYFLWIERFLSRFTDRIIAISDKQKEELLNRYKIGGEEKYSVVNLGLDLERFLQAEEKRGIFRHRHGVRQDDTLVGIVGRLVPVKNHRMFIDAARRLKGSMPPELFGRVKFVIVGDGPERQGLENYAGSLGIADKVTFTGWVDDMEALYADLNIMALTSENEGTPLSLIEAFASARAVIATDVGGVRDVLDDIGILVGSNETEAFSERLAELITSPARREEIGLRGREYVMKKFSKDNLIAQVEKLYEELMAEKGIYR